MQDQTRTDETADFWRAYDRNQTSITVLAGIGVASFLALTIAMGAQLRHAQLHMALGEDSSLSPVTGWLVAGTGGALALGVLWWAATRLQMARARARGSVQD